METAAQTNSPRKIRSWTRTLLWWTVGAAVFATTLNQAVYYITTAAKLDAEFTAGAKEVLGGKRRAPYETENFVIHRMDNGPCVVGFKRTSAAQNNSFLAKMLCGQDGPK